MDLNHVAHELRPHVPRFRIPMESRVVRTIGNGALRLLPARTVVGVRFERRDDVGQGLRLFIPTVRKSDGALLWIHGGGLIVGHPAMDDQVCAETARDLGIPVASVRYRLAPTHAYPAAINDCHTAWEWLIGASASLGIDHTRVAIGGRSAGGGLAAALAQRVGDGGAPFPIAQWLFCPMLDDRTAARRELDAEMHVVWDNRHNLFGWRAYLGGAPGAAITPPYAVPARRTDLNGQAPAWIGIGDIDLFYEEALAYARGLQDAGTSVTLDVVPGAPHGFEMWASSTGTARAYLERARSWLGQAIAARPYPSCADQRLDTGNTASMS